MPIPNNGPFRMYAKTVGQIVSGNFARTSAGAPPLITTQQAMTDYYTAGIDDPATAPRLWQGDGPIGGDWIPFIGTYELVLNPKYEVTFDPYGTPTTISFLDADFPNGFAANQFKVYLNGNLVTGGRDKYLNNYKLKAGGLTVLDVNPPNNISGDVVLSSNQFGPGPFDNAYWGAMQVLGYSMGFSANVISVVDAAARIPNLRADLVYIEGVYNLLRFTINMAVQNAGPGGEVTLTGTNLTGLDELSINWYDADAPSSEWLDPMIPNIVGGIVVPRNLILTWTSTLIRFRIPFNGIPYGGKRLYIMGRQISGTSFTGYTSLGQVNIQLVEGSGLYTLVEDKTDDTYYDRSLGGTTIDLKIPDPFVKTGFFNG